jgi:hypothetical protein
MQTITNENPMMKNRHVTFWAFFFPSILILSQANAQLNLAEAEKISKESGRTMFVVAGKKT